MIETLLQLSAYLLFCWYIALPMMEAICTAIVAGIGGFLTSVGMCCAGVIVVAWVVSFLAFVARRVR
ncbi:MAG TPA: hypothetical protein VF384_16935 [Planctomycetota bacterium]